jgi:hypothetical protein
LNLNLIGRRVAIAIFVATALVFAIAASATAQSSAPSVQPASALNQPILWLTVSPAYSKTGLVVAVDLNSALWVSRDGGATWSRPKAAGFKKGRPVITIDSSGREVMFNGGDFPLQRSDDGGETWKEIGPVGQPVPIPGAGDAVAVAGATDYLFKSGAVHDVAGSGGTLIDQSFALAPGFPQAGKYAPVLLVGLDRKTFVPQVQRCTADLVCTGSTALPIKLGFQFSVNVHFSTNYSNDGVVFVRTDQGVFKSSDGGTSFKPLTVAVSDVSDVSVPMMTLANGYKEEGSMRTAYASVLSLSSRGEIKPPAGGVYRTTDGGNSWKRIGTSLLDWGSTALAQTPDGRLLAGYFGIKGSGFLCSTDDKTWHNSCPPYKASGEGASSAKNILWLIAGLLVAAGLIVVAIKRRNRVETKL